MGLLSFLFGGTKKNGVAAMSGPAVLQPATSMVPTADPGAPTAVAPHAGVRQAKLRLRFAASLRSGEHAAAYEAAKGLADIQLRAGRTTVARVWQKKAERIRESMPA